jgi:hypothetical protein
MKTLLLVCALLAPLRAGWQEAEPAPVERESDRLPNGKLRQDEILKAEHEKSVRDAAQLVDLAESLKQDLEKNEHFVLSIGSIKKTEEIEKLAKRIRSRMRR